MRAFLPLLLAVPSSALAAVPRVALPAVRVTAAAHAAPSLSVLAPTAALSPRPASMVSALAFPTLPPLPGAAAAAEAPKSGLPGLPAAPMPVFIPASARPDAPLEEQTGEGRARFDLAAPDPGGADGAPVWAGGAEPALAPGWSAGSFEGEGGLTLRYKRRAGADPRLPARVFAGGLALNDSFETLFSGRPASRDEYFLWTRAHAPTGWTPTRSPLDADARDLARMLAAAARANKARKTELVLHSFGTLVFQRMLQLRGEPVVDEALASLSGSRVVFLHGTTRYEGSESRAGREFEQMGQATRAFTDWLDTADAMVELWEKTARLNPLLGPAVDAWLAQWRVQRNQVLAMGTRDAVRMMRHDLSEPWAPALEPMRKRFQEALEREAWDPGWQEAMLRRSGDMFRLAMTPADVRHLRKLGVSLEMVHARGDKLLNWETARALFDFYGLPSPQTPPEAGAELRAKNARAVIVDGDHYWPLKRPEALAELLGR